MFDSSKAVVLASTLRPETVAALENVPFSIRAKALPGVQDVLHGLDEVRMVGSDEDVMIDVGHCLPRTPNTEERMLVLDRYIVAGGLAYDDDASHLNPCDYDGNGRICHASTSRGTKGEQQEFYAALGLDEDGNKDFSCKPVADRIVKQVMEGLSKDLSTLTRLMYRLRATGRRVSKASLEDAIRFAFDQEGWEYALDHLVEALYGAPFWNRLDGELQNKLQPLADLFSESAAEQCWDEAFAAGEVGNTMAVLLDIYEHSGVAYSVAGTGMQCRWDTSRGAAIWVPDDAALDNIRSSVLSDLGLGKIAYFGAAGSTADPLHARFTQDGATWVGEGMGWSWRTAVDQLVAASATRIDVKKLHSMMYAKAKEYCKGVLEEYTDWVNGSVYGVLCYVIDRATGQMIRDEVSENWGYIGFSNAEDELESLILAKALQYGQPVH